MEKTELTLIGTIIAIDPDTATASETGLIYPQVSVQIGTKTVLHVGLTPEINNYLLDHYRTYDYILQSTVIFTAYIPKYPHGGETITPLTMCLINNPLEETHTE